MAALPSVVIGFIAGLWLASLVETHLVPVLLMMVLLPALRHGRASCSGIACPRGLRAAAQARAWSWR